MRWLILLLVLASCSQLGQDAFNEFDRESAPYNTSEAASANAGYVQTATGELVRKPGTASNATRVEPAQGPVELSITEQWKAQFWDDVDHYSYELETERYGRLYFFHTQNFTRIVPLDWLIDIKGNEAVRSRIGAEADHEYLLEDIRDGKRVMSYLWYTQSSTHGCFIDGGDPIKSNCYYWGSGVPIIHNDFTFERPLTPLDWLEREGGLDAVEVRRGYTFTDPVSGQQIQVDHYFFENPDGTRTKMHVHAGYHVPVRIEILGGSTVLETITFENLEINNAEISRHYQRLLAP